MLVARGRGRPFAFTSAEAGTGRSIAPRELILASPRPQSRVAWQSLRSGEDGEAGTCAYSADPERFGFQVFCCRCCTCIDSLTQIPFSVELWTKIRKATYTLLQVDGLDAGRVRNCRNFAVEHVISGCRFPRSIYPAQKGGDTTWRLKTRSRSRSRRLRSRR